MTNALENESTTVAMMPKATANSKRKRAVDASAPTPGSPSSERATAAQSAVYSNEGSPSVARPCKKAKLTHDTSVAEEVEAVAASGEAVAPEHQDLICSQRRRAKVHLPRLTNHLQQASQVEEQGTVPLPQTTSPRLRRPGLRRSNCRVDGLDQLTLKPER
jgi:hypothetical protein